MSAPRIAMVLNTMGLGGVPEVVFQLMRHLPKYRYDLKLFILKGEAALEPARAERLQKFAELGVDVQFASRERGKIGAIADLVDWMAVHRIDLLHTHSYRPNLYARMAGALCRPNGLFVIAHYHNYYDDKWDKDPAALTLERQLVQTCDAFIAVSQSVRRHVSNRLGLDEEHLEVIPNGVDLAQFQGLNRASARRSLGIHPSRFTAGLIGRVCEQKGQEDLVEAVVLLKRQKPEALFLLIGDIEDKVLHSRLMERIDRAGVADNIWFAGHMRDMPSIYAALDLVVAPSRWEGFGLMLVEAMASGLPIVATRVGAIEEVVREGETAILVPPRDPAKLADSLTALIEDPERRAVLGAAGQSQQGRFTWNSAAQRLARIYDRVLDRRTV